MRRRASTVSPWCCWLLVDSTPITPHSSAVDLSMRVHVWVIVLNLPPADVGELIEDVAGGYLAVVGQGSGREELAQLAGRGEVVLLVGETHLLEAVARVEHVEAGPHEFRGRRRGGG